MCPRFFDIFISMFLTVILLAIWRLERIIGQVIEDVN